MIRRIFLLLLLVVLCLGAAVAVNTVRLQSAQLQVAPAPKAPVDITAAAQRLAGAIPFKTISSQEDASLNDAEFFKLHEYLEKSFPRVHSALTRELIGGKSLLYTWKGSDPKAAPIALLAHQDVVPVTPGTDAEWKAPPFSGEIKDGFIWGRGTWDNKGNLFAQLEAVEMLLASGYQPARTVYFAMGHDEEVRGMRGARAIADTLKQRGVKLEFVLDEGLLVTERVLAGLDKPAALIGVAEKGNATFHLTLDGNDGHSSMPPPGRSTIGAMSAALARLDANPLPANIQGVAGETFRALAPEMGGLNRVLLSNLWLFKPLVQMQLEKSASANATLRTTTALTIVNAGNKENVLPGHAEAAVNFRILPGETIASVEQHVRRTVNNDAIKIRSNGEDAEPSPVSPTDSAGYRVINRTIRETFPDAVVVPGLMVAGTDSRHFTPLSDAVYRFSPVRARPEDLLLLHGTNERLSLTTFHEMIQFYLRLLQNGTGPQPAR